MKNNTLTFISSVLFTTGITISLFIGPAQARQQTTRASNVSCNVNNVFIGTIAAADCEGPFSGNDTGAQGTLLNKLNQGLFADVVGSGFTWELAGKSDESDPFGFDADNGSNIGEWSLAQALNSGTFVISLKTSNNYSAYLFQGIDFAQTGLLGTFNTIGVALNGSGQAGRDLSHASLFVAKTTTEPTKVPEPATLVGFGLIVAASFTTRRRQNNS